MKTIRLSVICATTMLLALPISCIANRTEIRGDRSLTRPIMREPRSARVEIRGDRSLSRPIMRELRSAFAEEHPDAAAKLQIRTANVWTNSEAFGRGHCDLLLSVGPLAAVARTIIAQHSPGGNFVRWNEGQVGQMRVLVIVNAANPVSQLSFQQLQMLLALGKGKKTTWEDLGGKGGLVTCYGEHEESASRTIVRALVMTFKNRKDPYVPGVRSSGHFLFRDNLAQCGDVQEVIDEVSRDKNGIGLLRYADDLPKEVRALALAADAGGQFVTPKLDSSRQDDYPLAQPVLLHLHPGASPEAQLFYNWVIQRYQAVSQPASAPDATILQHAPKAEKK